MIGMRLTLGITQARPSADDGLGPEVLVNGDFNSAAGWSVSGGWAVDAANGWAQTEAGGFIQRSAPLTAGITYRVQAVCSRMVSQTFFFALVGGTSVFSDVWDQAIGDGDQPVTFSDDLTALAGNNGFYMQPQTAGGLLRINSVSVRPIL